MLDVKIVLDAVPDYLFKACGAKRMQAALQRVEPDHGPDDAEIAADEAAQAAMVNELYRLADADDKLAVKDRVLAVNKVLREGDYRVNLDACPHLVEALEKQAYDKHGEETQSRVRCLVNRLAKKQKPKV